MTRSAFLRARRPEHKEQRRQAILDAARELAAASGVRTVSLGAVAEAVGLAKSNIVRYFGTREEIYLQLAAEEWLAWSAAVTERLPETADPDAVVTTLAETLAARPLFCDLLGNTSTSLEHNVSVAAAHAFKRTVVRTVGELGARIAPAAGLTPAEGLELAASAAGLAGMLYPAANPSPVLAQVYAQDPELAASCPPFVPTLVRGLRAIAAGLPTLRES
ncbi:Transcriptional regulator, TetR family [Nonomuraea coxensis DSM 45129]|uniref:Transcriptional regulator, TetR family n=1 Tax=Nonomuraea coxensis DSM 45129 TaxID=1122611 RepID=A0ABX8UBX1_9ACTN|nr:TetR/AcrR family transcriptional regulator [Nonomuraea coxensis]QYC45280.1 Transcriptional regulator, TetR family [Nonomuraea coxensis DSM 45129]